MKTELRVSVWGLGTVIIFHHLLFVTLSRNVLCDRESLGERCVHGQVANMNRCQRSTLCVRACTCTCTCCLQFWAKRTLVLHLHRLGLDLSRLTCSAATDTDPWPVSLKCIYISGVLRDTQAGNWFSLIIHIRLWRFTLIIISSTREHILFF